MQLEVFLQSHPSQLPLPPASGEDTIFEFVVSDKGQWEHWQTRVNII
jgi:dynein heavy chain